MTITEASIPFVTQLQQITLCTQDPRWFISSEGSLKISGLHTVERKSDRSIITLFISTLEEIDTISQEQIQESYESAKQYIQKSITIPEEEKNNFLKILTMRLGAYLSITGVKITAMINVSKTSKEGLKCRDIQNMELYLTLLSRERELLSLYGLFFYSMYSIHSIKKKVSRTRPLETAEDLSLATILESTSKPFEAKYKLLLVNSLKNDPSLHSSKSVQEWKFRLAIHSQEKTSEFLLNMITKIEETMNTRFEKSDFGTKFHLLEETKELLEEFSVTNEPVIVATEEALNKVINLLKKCSLKTSLLNHFYEYSFTFVQNEIGKMNRYSKRYLDEVFIGEPIKPEEFQAIQFPQIPVTKFYELLEQSVDTLHELALSGTHTQYFRTFLEFFFTSSACDDLERQFSKFYKLPTTIKKTKPPTELVSDMETLTLQEKESNCCYPPKPTSRASGASPSSKKPKKSRGVQQKARHHPNYQNREKTSTQPKETPKVKQPLSPTLSSKNYIVTKLTIDSRVSDWLKNNPKAFEKDSYKDLSDEEKGKERIFHSYPMIITHFLRKYTTLEKYATSSKLYSSAGTIKINGTTYTGYYADCFDNTSMLYHHYFHQRSLTELVSHYGKMATLLNYKNASEESQELGREPEEMEVQGNFEIRRRCFSLDVIDKIKEITYSLCLPEGTPDNASFG